MLATILSGSYKDRGVSTHGPLEVTAAGLLDDPLRRAVGGRLLPRPRARPIEVNSRALAAEPLLVPGAGDLVRARRGGGDGSWIRPVERAVPARRARIHREAAR